MSNKIWHDTNIGTGNIILMNPLDLYVLESFNDFNYVGDQTSGEIPVQYQAATVLKQYKTFARRIVPQGNMLIALKPMDPQAAVYYLAVYAAILVSPFPIGAIPSISFRSRYATALLRKEGLALIKLQPHP